MVRASRGPLGPVFLVLAVVALLAVALVPRGVVRAVAVEQLVQAGVPEAPPGVNDVGPRGVHIPGVRAMISREEQDPADALLEQVAAVEQARPRAATVASIGGAVRVRPPHGPATDAPTPDGRAPPAAI